VQATGLAIAAESAAGSCSTASGALRVLPADLRFALYPNALLWIGAAELGLTLT